MPFSGNSCGALKARLRQRLVVAASCQALSGGDSYGQRGTSLGWEGDGAHILLEICQAFKGKTRVNRQREVQALLREGPCFKLNRGVPA